MVLVLGLSFGVYRVTNGFIVVEKHVVENQGHHYPSTEEVPDGGGHEVPSERLPVDGRIEISVHARVTAGLWSEWGSSIAMSTTGFHVWTCDHVSGFRAGLSHNPLVPRNETSGYTALAVPSVTGSTDPYRKSTCDYCPQNSCLKPTETPSLALLTI